MRYVLRLSLSALAVVAAWGVFNARDASAQTVEQATPSCSVSAPYGYGASAFTAPVTCQISVPDQELTQNAVLFVQSASYAGLAPLSCAGVEGSGYETQAVSNSIPFAYGGQFASGTGCAFQVTAGIVPPGYPAGSFSLADPSGAVQLQTLICADPSCGATPAVTYYSGDQTYYPPTSPTAGLYRTGGALHAAGCR